MTTERDEQAKRIAQDVLDQTGAAILAHDFDAFAPHFMLPNKVLTFDGERSLETLEDLREVFDAVVQAHTADKVTRLMRQVEAARFLDDTTIQHTHTSSRFSGTRLVRGPHPSISVLRLSDGMWRISESQYAVPNWPMYQSAFVASEQRVASDVCAKIMQRTMDAICDAYLSGKVDMLLPHIVLPVHVQSGKGHQIIADEPQLALDFAEYMTHCQFHGVTDLVCKVKTAETIGTGRIVGIYRTFILSGDDLVAPSYDSNATLVQDDNGHWCLTSVTHGEGHRDWFRSGGGQREGRM